MKIEDYGLIGDLHTAALVGRGGSIDWLCLPRFDSPSCFAALVGNEENGRWLIAPADAKASVSRRYRPDTLVLETEFRAGGASTRITDFMPIREGAPRVVRLVTGLRGEMAMRMDLAIRLDYGRALPWVSRGEDDALIAIAGRHMLILRTTAPHRGEGLRTRSDFTVREGETVPFVLSYGASWRAPPKPIDPRRALRETEHFWRRWCGRCTYEGDWRDAVVRSLITLKALTYAPTGGIIAAPTTSLPERLGGSRNWDYRFCWLRDATLTLLALLSTGYQDEAEAWRQWLVRAVAGLPSQVQTLYGILGDRRLDEWEVPWLAGYEGARPVRIGNAASAQLQLDIFGEVLDAFHHARRGRLAPQEASWALQKLLLQRLEEVMGQPDRSIWETRGADRHFTYSKVMSWVAFDRAVTAVEHFGLEGPVEHWRRLRDRLHAEVCRRGFDAKLGCFVQSYESRELDAAGLLIPLVGFLPPDDPRVVGTVDAVRKRLTVDGLVKRYETATSDDGLPAGEGIFLACSFWLADDLALLGRREEAQKMFERLLSLRNDLGLLAEEYDVASGRQLGNFPQAFSHLALIGTAQNLLGGHHGPAHSRPRRDGAS